MNHPFSLGHRQSPATARNVGAAFLAAALMGFTFATAICCPAAAEEEEAIEIELPEGYFGGTPVDYFGPNYEKPSYKPRPPFMAPKGTENVAAEKDVSSSDLDPKAGSLEFLVDGDKSYSHDSLLRLADGHQWVQIDLGEPHRLYAFLLWHYHQKERVYFDVAVQVASDAKFTKDVQFVFNNDHDNSAGLGVGKDKEYLEDHRGKLVDLKGVTAQYVRLYSKGHSTGYGNTYVEVEVFGKPVE